MVSARSAPARVVRGEPWVVEGLGVIFIGNNVSTNELQLHARLRLGTSVAAYQSRPESTRACVDPPCVNAEQQYIYLSIYLSIYHRAV